MKLDIGTRVISKKTGLPITGQIVGILKASVFWETWKGSFSDFRQWTELYPDWRDKYVYMVEFDEPVKPATPQETAEYFKRKLGVDLESDTLIDYYNNRVHKEKFATYPEDDLEVFE